MSELAPIIDVHIQSDSAKAGADRIIAEYNRIIAGARPVAAANDNIIDSLNRFGRESANAGRGAGVFDNMLSRVRGSLGSLGIGTAVTGLLSITGAFTAATRAASQYADVVAKISTNVDEATFNMRALSAGIMEQSRAFGGSPVQQAEAAYDIISAGAEDASKALELLTTSNKLAVGGITNVTVAADGLTSVVNAYAARGLKAAEASDSMFISARDGKVSIEQLSANLGQVAPLAATVGVSFDEVTGSIAVLTKGGIKASESVTGVKAILSSIIKPSDEAAKLAKKLGIEFNSAGLATMGLRGVLQQVAEKTKGSSEMMAVLYGGTEALVPALALTANKGREFATVMDHMATKAGSTEAAVKKIMEGSPGFQQQRAMAAMNVELTNMGASIARVTGPAFKLLADNMSSIVTVIEVAMIPLAARMVGLWGGAMVQSLVTLGATAAMRFASMAAAQGVLAASTATLSGAMSGLLGIVGGPLGLAIGAAAVGLYTLHSNSSAARDTVEQLAASAQGAAKGASDTGVQSLLAARGVTTFGGQAGAAAERLWQMANAARAAAIETAKLNFQKAKATFDTAYGQTTGGIKRRAGKAWNELEDPNQTFGDAARSTGALVQSGWDYLWRPSDKKAGAATRVAYNQAQTAWKALQEARGSKPEGFLPKPVDAPAPYDKNADKKERHKKTDAERLQERVSDWWKKTEADGTDAKALADALAAAAVNGKNLSVVSADVSKELEFQRLVGRDITDAERQRIETAQQQGRNAKFYSDQLVAAAQRGVDLAQQETLLKLRQGGATEAQLGVEKAILDNREAALKSGVDLASEGYRLQEAALRKDLERGTAIQTQNKALDDQAAKMAEIVRAGQDYGKSALRDNGTVAQRRAAAQKEYDDRVNGMAEAVWSTDPSKRLSPDEFEAGVKQAGIELQDRFRDIGTEFSNKMGRVAGLLDRIGVAIGGKAGEAVSGISGIVSGVGDFSLTKDSVSGDFQRLFAKNSDLVKGIGNAVGGAVGGLQISESIQGLSKTLGIKLNGTGSKIGGAIGGAAFGPIGSIIGSIGGGLIGNLFAKAPKGKSIITSGTDAAISGNKSSVRNALTGTSGSIQSGLQAAAQQLGGELGSFMVSVGKYKDSFRVSSTGASNVDTKKSGKISGLIYNGKDEAAAITAAIKDAILDGAITGLSDLMNKALKAQAGNVDKAIDSALKFKAFEDDFKALTNPIGSAIDAIKLPLDSLRKTMLDIGASSTDLAKLEEYRGLKMKAAFEEQTSGFNDLLKSLNGNAGGVTSLNQLTNNLAEFEKYRNDIAAGKTVDQSKFVELANTIAGLNGDVYGPNSKEFQANVEMLKSATNGAVDLVKKQFDPADASKAQIDVAKAIGDAQLANSDITNDYLSQILVAINNGQRITNYITGGGRAPNGQLINAY